MKHSAFLHSSTRNQSPINVALLVWCVLFFIVAAKILIAPESHTVFPKFAAGATHWWSGQSLYAHYDNLGAFRYSPTFAVCMIPFALMGNRIGGIVWSGLNIAAFVWGMRRMARDVLPRTWPPEREALLLCLAMPGQSPVSGTHRATRSLPACSWAVFGPGAPPVVDGGMLLAGTVFLKLSPLALAVLSIGLDPRRMSLRFIAALGIGAIIPFLTQPRGIVIAQYADWFKYLHDTSEQRWPSFRDAWTVWELIAGRIHVFGYRCIQIAVGIGVLAWCLWQQRRLRNERSILTLTLAMGVSYLLVFGPAAEPATYALIAPITVWGLIASCEQRKYRPLMLIAFITTSAFAFGAVERAAILYVPAITAALPTGTLLFASWLVLHAHRPCTLEVTVQTGHTM